MVKLSDRGGGGGLQPSPPLNPPMLDWVICFHVHKPYAIPQVLKQTKESAKHVTNYTKNRADCLWISNLLVVFHAFATLVDSRVFLLSTPDTVTASTHVCCPACCASVRPFLGCTYFLKFLFCLFICLDPGVGGGYDLFIGVRPSRVWVQLELSII